MKDEILKLNQLIVNNRDFDVLEAKLNVFNPFKILKIDSYEIRHSNILAWLFNPKGNHGLNDKFLKKVLSEIIIRNEEVNIKNSIMNVYSGNFQDTEVFREWNHVDILVVSQINRIVLIIENKIYSDEHGSQLSDYLEKVRNDFPEYDIIPVYLTLTGSKPKSSKKWLTFDYSYIYVILKDIISLYKENMNGKIYDFIKYYLDVLEELTMQDNETIDLCKKIYNEHKESIDLIIKYGVSSSFSNAVQEFCNNNKSINKIVSNNNIFTFLPEEIINIVPKIKNKTYSYDNYYIEFYFGKFDEKLALFIEIEPFDNNFEMRKKFLMHLKKKYSFKIPNKAFEEGSKYTKIFSKYMSISDWDSVDEIIGVMQKLYNEDALESTNKIIQAVKEFNWDNNSDKFIE